MLLKALIKYYWIIGFLIYSIFSYSAFRSQEYIYLYATSLIAFLAYGIVMTFACSQKHNFFTAKSLALIVFIYSLIGVGVLHTLSEIIDGDTFLFSKIDAIFYYTNTMQLSRMGVEDGLKHLQAVIGFDDWGAFFWMVSMFKIIPSQIFVSFSYCVLGVVTSLMLFNIGRQLMPRRYAYLSALAFSIASFTVTLHAVFLKESVMVCIIIVSFNSFYNFLRTKSVLQLVIAFLLALLIVFFRIPVFLILVFSFSITLVLKYLRKPLVAFLVVVVLLIVVNTSYIQYSHDRYLRGGDVELIIEQKNKLSRGGGIVEHLADPIAATIGPFPGLVSKTVNRNTINASGLLFRLLLTFVFLLGVYYAYIKRDEKIYPLLIFFFINAIGVAISVKGLEFRLTYPHLPMVYIVAFWMLARFDYHKVKKRLSPKLFYASILCVLVICILWNMRGV